MSFVWFFSNLHNNLNISRWQLKYKTARKVLSTLPEKMHGLDLTLWNSLSGLFQMKRSKTWRARERNELCAAFFLSSPLPPPSPHLHCHSWIPPQWETCGWVQWGKGFALGTRGRKRSYHSVVVAMGQKVSVAGLWEPGLPMSPAWLPSHHPGEKHDGKAVAVSCCWCRNEVVHGHLRAFYISGSYFSKDNFEG